jgi:hypothetical protein
VHTFVRSYTCVGPTRAFTHLALTEILSASSQNTHAHVNTCSRDVRGIAWLMPDYLIEETSLRCLLSHSLILCLRFSREIQEWMYTSPSRLSRFVHVLNTLTVIHAWTFKPMSRGHQEASKQIKHTAQQHPGSETRLTVSLLMRIASWVTLGWKSSQNLKRRTVGFHNIKLLL